MDEHHFAIVTPLVTRAPSRRDVLHGLVGAGLGLGVARLPEGSAAKKRHKKRRKKNKDARPLCARNGERCDTQGVNCQTRYCLTAPLTIEAKWTNDSSDHDTILFVPARDQTTGPSPHIYYACNPDISFCVEAYPFACVSKDARGPGDEITTVYRLLSGIYEYWIGLAEDVAAGELVIVLSDGDGRVVREWTNPANATDEEVGWHVFDVDEDGRVTSIDVAPGSFPNPDTDVCPYAMRGRQGRGRAATRATKHRPEP